MKSKLFAALADVVGVGQAFTVRDVVADLHRHPEARQTLALMGAANIPVLGQLVAAMVGESVDGLTLVRTRASRRGHLYALIEG
jgi:hypothetical protein